MNREIGSRRTAKSQRAGYVGCAVWDIFELVRDLKPTEIGICFDIGHATLEGGTSWPVEARLMEPISSVFM
jgi:sugar phosphate isomerase/epimerase